MVRRGFLSFLNSLSKGYMPWVFRLVFAIGSACLLSLVYSLVALLQSSRKINDIKLFMQGFEHLKSCKVILNRVTQECAEVVVMLGPGKIASRYSKLEDLYEMSYAILSREFLSSEGQTLLENLGADLYEELQNVRLKPVDLRYIKPIVCIQRFNNFIQRIAELSIKPLISQSTLFPHKMTLAVQLLINSLASSSDAMLTGLLYFKQGFITLPELLVYATNSENALRDLNLAFHVDSFLKETWDVKQKQMEAYWNESRQMEMDIFNNVTITTLDNVELLTWLQRSKFGIEVLDNFVDEYIGRFQSVAAKEIERHEKYIIYESVVLAVILGVALPLNLFSAFAMSTNLANYIKSIESKSVELQKEKRKTENIVQEILPTSLALKLQMGEKIVAEQFEAVTIFFSDIVDFVEISSKTTPVKVVDFLNEVYSFIDLQILQYDVYKVETIGSVYMVSSGIPNRNGNRHSAEIARLSLNLVQACADFAVPSKNDQKLMLRIGVHTGPVVGGVVGNRLPRYCLFGDAVNTASRMQSHGLPNKIHISEATHNELLKNYIFRMESRGCIYIKGKGEMNTYWLVGKKGIQKFM